MKAFKWVFKILMWISLFLLFLSGGLPGVLHWVFIDSNPISLINKTLFSVRPTCKNTDPSTLGAGLTRYNTLIEFKPPLINWIPYAKKFDLNKTHWLSLITNEEVYFEKITDRKNMNEPTLKEFRENGLGIMIRFPHRFMSEDVPQLKLSIVSSAELRGDACALEIGDSY